MKITNQENLLIDRLIDKSIEAFIFAIEIINKPTLKHRSENFLFNICNAWELALKAFIITSNGEDAIYFKDNKKKTVSLKQCVEFVFTDFKNHIKTNLNTIIKLRDQSIHFITPEYDELYISFFQANVLYYVEYMRNNFKRDLNKELPSNFLTIAANPKQLKDVKLIDRIDKSSFKAFLKAKKQLIKLSAEDGNAIVFEVRMKSVKKDPDITFKIDPNTELTTQVINKIMDPSNSHPYRAKDIIKIINKENCKTILNQYKFLAIKKYEKFEELIDYYYFHKQSKSKTYSEKALNIIRKNIKEYPNYINICVETYKKK